MKKLLITAAGILGIVGIILGVLTILRNINKRQSVILTNPCDAPCWYGIKPGPADPWEVYEVLNNLEDLSIEAVSAEYDRQDKLVSYYWFFVRPIEDNGGSINFDGDQVNAISILTTNSLTLGHLFGKLGEPEEYWKELGKGEQRDYLDVTLLYPSKGYAVEVILDYEAGVSQVKINKGTPVFRVTYFALEKYQELIQTKILIDKAVNARTGSMHQWVGYGEIDFE